MEADSTNKAVRELLDKMVRDLPGYRWDSLCAYSDGMGHTIIEINIFRKSGQESAGRISYHLESGEVMTHHYPAFEGKVPETIVDFLLDVFNLEKRLSEAESSI
jgi:hypothetical protein